MKKTVLLAVVSVFVFAQPIFAATLVFKATKEILSDEIGELCVFDATKFSKIRIAILSENRIEPKTKTAARNDLNAAKRELNDLMTVQITDERLSEAQKEVQRTQKIYDSALEYENVGIYGIEDGSAVKLSGFFVNSSEVIDLPLSKISIKGYGKGKYKILVWAN